MCIATIVVAVLQGCGGAGREAPVGAPIAPPIAPAESAEGLDARAPADDPLLTSLQLGPDETVVLDPRAKRPLPVLVAEISSLKMLLKHTEAVKPPPDPSMLLRLLAEAHAELAEAAKRDAQAALDRYDPATAKARGSIVAPARRSAITYYRALLDAPTAGAYTRLDAALWFLAWEYVRVGDAANARSMALSLVDRHPASRYAARGYFLLGALLMAGAATDASRYGEAEKAFAQAARSSEPRMAEIALDRVERSARLAGDTAAADAAARDLARAINGPSDGPAPDSAGCTKDVDCKGNRICDRGLCTAPQ